MTRAARILWAVLTATLLVSCGGGGSDDGQADLMSSDWHAIVDTEFHASGSNGWFTCRSSAVDCFDLPFATDPSGAGYGTSSYPWWVDPNHAPPGLGYLHLVAYAYHIDCVREGIIEPVQDNAPIDLRNARVTLRWRAPTLQLPAGARLLFWYQNVVDLPGATTRRYVNHVLQAQPLVAAPGGDWQTDQLTLGTNAGDYACLGSAAERADRYGCDIDPVTALKNWNLDLGFIILFPDEASALAISGVVEFDRITIEIPKANIATHDPVPGVTPMQVRCGP